MAYNHIRSLIYRPVVVANLGDKGSSALVAVGDTSKHIVQIVQLLEERKLSFSFCLNRNEVLVQAGFGLLFQTLDLDRDGKLIKDCNRLSCTVMDMLDNGTASGASEFRRVGCSMIAIPHVEQMPTPILARHNSEGTMAAPMDRFRATQKSLKAIAARFSPDTAKARLPTATKEPRRATLPNLSPSLSNHPNHSSTSLSSLRSEPHNPRSEPSLSPLSHRASFSGHISKRRPSHLGPHLQNRNIDFLSFGVDPLAYNLSQQHHPHSHAVPLQKDVSPSDWERILSSLDNGQTNIYDSIYGGPPAEALVDSMPLSAGAEANPLSWSPNMWGWGACNGNSGEQAPPPQSVLSFSDESLTSGEEFANSVGEYGTTSTPGSDKICYHGIVMPNLDATAVREAGMGLTGLDGNFGL